MKYRVRNRTGLIRMLESWNLDNNIFSGWDVHFRVFESLTHELAHAAVLRIPVGPKMTEDIEGRFVDIDSGRRSDTSELLALAVQFLVLKRIYHPYGRMAERDIFRAAVDAMCDPSRSPHKLRTLVRQYQWLPSVRRHADQVIRHIKRLDGLAAAY